MTILMEMHTIQDNGDEKGFGSIAYGQGKPNQDAYAPVN